MQVEISKGQTQDYIRIERSDGSIAETTFPKKGPIPHDVVHYFVEKELGFGNAFWGMVASGIHPEAIAEIAKQAGHASASRATTPDDNIVELLQAERIVECFEADSWSHSPDNESLAAIAKTACESSFVPLPEMDNAAIETIRSGIAAFAREWTASATGFRFRFDWE